MENTELSVIVYVVPTLLMMLACLCWHFPIGILLGAHFRLTHLLATVCKIVAFISAGVVCVVLLISAHLWARLVLATARCDAPCISLGMQHDRG